MVFHSNYSDRTSYIGSEQARIPFFNYSYQLVLTFAHNAHNFNKFLFVRLLWVHQSNLIKILRNGFLTAENTTFSH